MIDTIQPHDRARCIRSYPIEFLHRDRCRSSTARGRRTGHGSFHDGLRYVAAGGSDIILVGEIRNLGAMSTALDGRDTGHVS